MSLSAKASTDDVTSSHRISVGSLSNARAMLTFCRSPPDSRAPRSPTEVWMPSLSLASVSLRLQRSTARRRSSSVAEALP